MAEPDPDITRDSLSARIYAHLRDELMTGLHAPGSRISIRKLAIRLDTSPTPVREAVFQLIREGALELRPGFQPRVPVLDLTAYLHIRDTRVPMERLAGELASVHITPDEIDALKTFHDAYAQGIHDRDWRAAVLANQAFHLSLYRASRNAVLVGVIENLWLLSGPFVAEQLPHAVQMPTDAHPHLMILDALRRRSPMEAGDLLVRDLREGAQRIISRLHDPAGRKRSRKGRKSGQPDPAVTDKAKVGAAVPHS